MRTRSRFHREVIPRDSVRPGPGADPETNKSKKKKKNDKTDVSDENAQLLPTEIVSFYELNER